MITLILSCSIAISISFLCSLAEAVLLSTDTLKMHKLKTEGKTFAITLIKMKENIGRPIAAILILNTIAHTGGATIAAGAFHDIYGDRWLWLFSVIFTVIVLFGTELLPKILGISYSDQLVPIIVKPLDIISRILAPIIWLSDLISKRFRPPQDHKVITMPQIVTLVNLARASKLIVNEQEKIIVNAIELHNNQVKSIMIPKEKVVFLQTKISTNDIISIIEKTLYTRYPVSETDNLEDALSYINIKTIVSQLGSEKIISWNKVTRSIIKVPDSMTLVDLLKLFNDKKQHIALVINEEQKVIGLVTIEDVISEILGNENSPLDVIK